MGTATPVAQKKRTDPLAVLNPSPEPKTKSCAPSGAGVRLRLLQHAPQHLARAALGQAVDELHLALMAVDVYGETYACTDVYMSALGEKLNIKQHTLHVPGCLRRIKTRDPASRARVIPLPFLHISAKLGV